MALAGQETTLNDCDANIAMYYRLFKMSDKKNAHTQRMMNKSLDRRLQLIRETVSTGS